MNIDVANMVVNLGEQLQKVNWLDAGVTFTSVFLGAFLAHRFNLKLEMRKAKRQMRGDFCSLVSQIHLDFSEMIDFKKRYLDEIRKTYEEGNMNSFLVTKGFPCMSFILDIDKYIFLSDCNRCFLSELKIIKYNNNQLNNAWQDYMLAISDLADLLQNRDKDATKLMKEKFFKIYEIYSHLCVRIYYLNKNLSICYERFFNVNYYDDFETDDQLGKEILQCISQEKQKEFADLDKDFNKCWAPDHTFWEDIKYYYRKIKYCLKGLKIYFFGRGKPKTKCKSEGKK